MIPDRFGSFLNGRWLDAGVPTPNLNPSNLADQICLTLAGDADTTAEAIAAARAALPGWSQSTPQQRFDVLDQVGARLLAEKEAIGRLLAREEGKTLAEGIGETARAGQIFKYFAGEALRIEGRRLASTRPGVEVEVTREPVGVVGLITPWNFPIAIPAWKAAPALAYGNTVVIKPAELTPGCVAVIARLLAEAGLPAGVFNVVFGPGAKVGAALVEGGIDALSFTGSVPTGARLRARAAERGVRVQLEMGGKNPLVVLDDADLAIAVGAAVNGAFFSTGQRCTASSRIIVTEGIHDRFVAALVERTQALRVGDALDPKTEIGPVVDRRQLDSNLAHIERARAEGARLACGGERLNRETEGFFQAPALFVDTSPEMAINREEVFGPVASVIRCTDYEAALELANETPFGLSAGICTTSLKHASHFKRHAQAGMVMVNLPTAGVDHHVPFGGRKASSYGPREQGPDARDFYTAVKTAYTLPG